jgi:hypothetical protein
MPDGAPRPSQPPILAWGALAATLSALATYYYLLSIVLYPVWLAIFVVTFRRYRRSPASPIGIAGLSLAVGALVMPAVGAVSYRIYQWLDLGVRADGSIATGWEFYGPVYTPVVLAFVIGTVGSALLLRARSRRGSGSPAS